MPGTGRSTPGGGGALVDDVTRRTAVTGGVLGASFPHVRGDGVQDRLRDGARVGLALALVVDAVAAVALVIMAPRPVAAPSTAAHQALAAWINAETDTTTVLEVPADVRADLIRDGVAARRLGPGGTFLVTRGGPGPGPPVARFGDGPDTLAVSRTDTGSAAETAVSASWGRQLLANPAVVAEDRAAEVLQGGRADPRAVLVLAVLAARGPVHVLDLPGVPAEDPGVPRHQVVLDGLNSDGRAWVKAQRPPFTPLVTTDGDTTTLAWAVPAPPGLLGP